MNKIIIFLIFVFVLIYAWEYSLGPRIEAFKQGNYYCMMAPDAFTCMRSEE